MVSSRNSDSPFKEMNSRVYPMESPQIPDVDQQLATPGMDTNEDVTLPAALFTLRKTSQSPYKGYFKDSMELINAGKYDNDGMLDDEALQKLSFSEIEYRASLRRRDFREKLAMKVLSRMDWRRGERSFQAWKEYAFRYVVVRNHMVRCFRMRFLSFNFHAWRAVARREHILRRVIKRFWFKHRMYRFKWWKMSVRWVTMKVGLLSMCFQVLVKNRRKRHLVYRRFAQISIAMRRLHSIRIIVRAISSYQHRKIYWAHKTIKNFVYGVFQGHIYRLRAAEERVRMNDEEIVYRAIVERARKFLRDKLEEDEGIELLRKYLADVDASLRRESVTKEQVFPLRSQDRQFATLFTTRAKAMYILNKRGELDVVRLSREKFRRSAKPPYYCTECMSVFLTGAMSRLHKRLGCPHDDGIHTCTSWRLAREITELALQRLLVNFFHQPQGKKVVR